MMKIRTETRLRSLIGGAPLIAVLSLPAPAALGASWDEGSEGDLSDTAGSPTSLVLELGANTLTATFGSRDFDFLTITVATGFQLDSIFLDAYSGASESFVGVQTGSSWTTGTGNNIDPATLLGWTHYGAGLSIGEGAGVGDDILDNIGLGDQGATGFIPPLPSGTYTFLLQDTGGAVTSSFTLNVSAVPEPELSTLMLMGMAAVMGIARIRRRSFGLVHSCAHRDKLLSLEVFS
jgi:hypothetical protein